MMTRFGIVFISVLSFIYLSCKDVVTEPPQPILPVPTAAQLEWHRMEMNAFVHFTINTFTDKEWGFGDESPELFNPGEANVDQWISLFDEIGFKGVILTSKHHDGFCLWPSEYTTHDVASSPYREGKGDIVKEVAEACAKHGLKFGIYLSPWDRNHAQYGTDAYITYYRNQLKELFDIYAPVFEMWFDGANGGDGYYGGANETRRINGATYYDWPGTIELVRSMEPNIIFFSDAGPGVRWVGNEKGIAGETNWNLISPDTLYAGKAGIESLLNTGSEDGTHWIPAETDVSIRPGWFYHEREDSLVKSPEKLFEIYLSSVGRGSTLLMNIPPDKRGLIHERDHEALRGFKSMLDEEFKTNLATDVAISVSNTRRSDERYAVLNLIDSNPETYWATDDEVTSAEIEISWDRPQVVKYVVLQEFIELGQRVKKFSIEAMRGDGWEKIGEGTTIGNKRIVKIEARETQKLKIRIEDARGCPVMREVEVY